jgi:hypothetical protein
VSEYNSNQINMNQNYAQKNVANDNILLNSLGRNQSKK